ncbi:conserved hypothetical protein [Mesorhizobium prunaredense]|uniref:Exopolysaccharide repressor protein n=1 Tax=Mesorhizobium prunaredense TaxID=1631249 RepID=A0A1R3V9R2_9HYPH|nr:exopolysaccharide production repressor protein [Mesorhizobium prunaredense]SIT55991.1 conserved hypothetical protein [Mesorhizobium prunaredense]
MRFITFFRLQGLVLFGSAVTVYIASHSIRAVVVAMLACLLLLQMVYFASVLFLVRRSGGADKTGQSAGVSGSSQKFRCQSPNDDEVRDESPDVLLRNPMLGISLLIP